MKNILSPEEQIAENAAMETLTKEVKDASISKLAGIISRDWKRDGKKVYFGAVPYLDAMYSLDSVNDNFGHDSGRSIVTYFLSNAQTWRGPVAKIVKAELNKRIKR